MMILGGRRAKREIRQGDNLLRGGKGEITGSQGSSVQQALVSSILRTATKKAYLVGPSTYQQDQLQGKPRGSSRFKEDRC